MTKNLILSGGPAHDYARTSPALAGIFAEVGIDSQIHEDLSIIESSSLQQFDMLTLNCARWTCGGISPDHEWFEYRFELPEAAREELIRFFERGKGLLALHTATLCFDDWDEYARIIGATFTGHGPFQDYRMQVHTDAHPITKGITDFVITDELYTDPKLTDSVQPLVESEWKDRMHPVLWVRNYRKARVCYIALGHGVEAFGNPSNQKLLQRGALWVADKLND